MTELADAFLAGGDVAAAADVIGFGADAPAGADEPFGVGIAGQPLFRGILQGHGKRADRTWATDLWLPGHLLQSIRVGVVCTQPHG
jgi:hypothetical protein